MQLLKLELDFAQLFEHNIFNLKNFFIWNISILFNNFSVTRRQELMAKRKTAADTRVISQIDEQFSFIDQMASSSRDAIIEVQHLILILYNA